MSRCEAREVAFHLLYMIDLHQDFSPEFSEAALESCQEAWSTGRQGWKLGDLRRRDPKHFRQLLSGELSAPSAEPEASGSQEQPDQVAKPDSDHYLGYLYGFGLNKRGLPFCRDLVIGVLEHLEEIDEALRPYLKVWDIARLPMVDRALLRLGVYEICHEPSVPKSVTISEIITLSQLYSTEVSHRYINAVLANFEGPNPEPSAERELCEESH